MKHVWRTLALSSLFFVAGSAWGVEIINASYDVADGLPVDVVTFNQVTDVDFLAKQGLVGADWSKRLPNNASPYYSLPMFIVRAGNPKKIADWKDLARPGVQVVFPNPKTSGNYRVQDPAVAKKYAAEFKPVKLATPEEVFGGWDKITTQHFATDAILDKALLKAAAH